MSLRAKSETPLRPLRGLELGRQSLQLFSLAVSTCLRRHDLSSAMVAVETHKNRKATCVKQKVSSHQWPCE
eukprot:4358822-Amphidinium_carterae.1